MPRKTNFKSNGKDYFRVTATIGRNSDGSAIRKQFYGLSKKEAEAKRDEYLANISKGLSANFDKAVFRVVFKSWFYDVLKPTLSLSSFIRYEMDYRLRIMDCCLSDMKLAEIKPINIQGFYNGLSDQYSANTVRNTHKLLRNFFGYCVRADLIVKNPLVAVETPKDDKISDTNTAISDADINALLQAAKNDLDNFIFVFAVFTGLRQGELLALAHRDVDLHEGVIHVNKSVKYLTVDGEYKPILSQAKTGHSVRTIPVLGEIRTLLKAHIRREKEKHLRLGLPFSPDSILFSSETGTYREGSNILKSLTRLCNRIEIERTTFHSLRHTFCTILAKHGVPLKTASELMGHANIAITAKIYTHVDMAQKRKRIENPRKLAFAGVNYW